jgi:hypothetical protein
MFPVAPLRAQTASRPPAGAAQAIPDLSGIWETPYNLIRKDICGEPSCRALARAPQPPPEITEEPQMLPWAEERYKVAREGIQNPNANGHEEADPWFSACLPFSPTMIMFFPFSVMELRQFPDVVLLLYGGNDDRTLRRIYVDGRGHPPNGKPSWMGHSIGRYDGDTLVVDTIGIRGDRWIDRVGRPHSDALHLVERFRRADRNKLAYEVTIEDPKAYKKPWTKKLVRELSPSGAQYWDGANCEDLLQMGTHYSAESPK